MFPVKWLVTQRACVTADFWMSGVGMRTQVCLVEETAPTDIAEVLIGPGVQPLVFDVARIWEQCFSARFARLVRGQFRLCARRHVRRKRLHRWYIKGFATHTRQFVRGDHVRRGRHQHAINWVRIIVRFNIYSAFCQVERPRDQVQRFCHSCQKPVI